MVTAAGGYEAVKRYYYSAGKMMRKPPIHGNYFPCLCT